MLSLMNGVLGFDRSEIGQGRGSSGRCSDEHRGTRTAEYRLKATTTASFFLSFVLVCTLAFPRCIIMISAKLWVVRNARSESNVAVYDISPRLTRRRTNVDRRVARTVRAGRCYKVITRDIVNHRVPCGQYARADAPVARQAFSSSASKLVW